MEWDKLTDELRKPLDPRHVKPPPQGKYGEYVDGYHVVSEANRIFGEGNWSYEIRDMRQVCRVETTDRNGGPQIRVGYYCAVKVHVNGGSFKEGAAVGTGIAKADNEADAHESAVKEAETDALKRALRTYGNTFGLALYDKTKANVGVARDPAAIRDGLLAAIAKRATHAELRDLNNTAKFSDALKWLWEHDEPKAREVKKALDDAMNTAPTEPV